MSKTEKRKEAEAKAVSAINSALDELNSAASKPEKISQTREYKAGYAAGRKKNPHGGSKNHGGRGSSSFAQS